MLYDNCTAVCMEQRVRGTMHFWFEPMLNLRTDQVREKLEAAIMARK